MSTKNKVFQLRLDEETRAQLKWLAKHCNTSESEFIRWFIQLFYKNINKNIKR